MAEVELSTPKNRWFRRLANPLRRLGAAKRRDRQRDRAPTARRRIVLWALAIGLLSGFFDLPLPVEDSLRAARSGLRLHAADQSVLVVTVDDRTLNAVGARDTRRDDDARFLDTLFELGARRVFFDRAYADESVPRQDFAFVEALKRHKPYVYLGALAEFQQPDGTTEPILPNPIFRPHANMVSIKGWKGPFGLSTRFPARTEVLGKSIPSLSAELAGVDSDLERYRVDFSIDYKTIPTASYIDVLRRNVSVDAISGRDIVVAPSSRINNDYHPVPYRQNTLGAFLHVLGAETLKNGRPVDLRWYPAFALAALIAGLQLRRRQPSRVVMGLTFAALLTVPLGLDMLSVNMDVMPALIALSITWFRLQRFAKDTYRGATGLQRIETMQAAGTAPEMDVVALKIRNFATISANLSPEEVEELLIKAQAMLRAADPVAEVAFEKDTFVWMRPKVSSAELENHARGLHALFRTSITIGSHAPDVASSIGIDAIHELALRERIENAIQCAEDAAHSSRIFMVSEPALAEERAWRLQILSELENAIRNDEADVAFQPKVALATEAIVGAEALLRWTHPVRGPIDPAAVIASAEEHNRVDMITQFVLNRALREARRAVAVDPSFKVAVNISALDLRDPSFANQVETLLTRHRFSAGNLVLEITETAPIENDAIAAVTLAALKRLGVRLSVDDFGIGHASLHYLRQIPADEVKIDRSFVVGMESSPEDRALVRTAIDMIHSLGRSAVAEGVENKATVELLREMGCDTAQGYFYYRPITMETLVPRLRKGSIAA
ncbi:EAL domain-containing protein [Tsuneonella sp. HG249]